MRSRIFHFRAGKNKQPQQKNKLNEKIIWTYQMIQNYGNVANDWHIRQAVWKLKSTAFPPATNSNRKATPIRLKSVPQKIKTSTRERSACNHIF